MSSQVENQKELDAQFARDNDAVIVQIAGVGPTDPRYFNPAGRAATGKIEASSESGDS